MKLTLYTTGCPNCKVLKNKLDKLNLVYEVVEDVEIMKGLGFTKVPVLQVTEKEPTLQVVAGTPELQIDTGKYMEFSEAMKWVEKMEKMEMTVGELKMQAT